MDRAGAEERAVPGAVAALVQPHRDFLRSERTGLSIAVSGEIEGANNDLGLDRLARRREAGSMS